MAKNYNNMYDYGTSPRKLQPEYTPNRKNMPPKQGKQIKQNNNKNKEKLTKQDKIRIEQQIKEQEKKKKQRKVVLYITIGFIILFAISYRNSQIDEQFSKIQSLQNELSVVEKENEQLEVNIENGSNLNSLEQAAKEVLGMQKLNNKQSVYVSLPKVDYIEGSEN